MKMLLLLPGILEISLENRKAEEKSLGTASKPLSMTSSLKESKESPGDGESGILRVDQMIYWECRNLREYA